MSDENAKETIKTQLDVEQEIEQEAVKKKAGKAGKNSDPALVKMTKGSDTLEVHPSCVANHITLGWLVD